MALPETNPILMQAFDPVVKVQNDIFPPFEELCNCSTCRRGRKLPHENLADNEYHRHCTWDLKTHIGFKHLDNDCTSFQRLKIERTYEEIKHGW